MNTNKNPLPIIISAADFMAQEFIDPDAQKVELTESGDVVVHCDFGQYYIELPRIKAPLHLLNWIHHLCEKDWMTPGLIRGVIEKTCAAKGWDFYQAF